MPSQVFLTDPQPQPSGEPKKRIVFNRLVNVHLEMYAELHMQGKHDQSSHGNEDAKPKSNKLKRNKTFSPQEVYDNDMKNGTAENPDYKYSWYEGFNKSGVNYLEIRDEFGNAESSTTEPINLKTLAGVENWFKEHDIEDFENIQYGWKNGQHFLKYKKSS